MNWRFDLSAGRRQDAPVHLARLRLRDYRNYARLDLAFEPGFHLLMGANAQGKTNLLEAIYLLATLRSFRGVTHGHLVREGAPGYFVGATVVGQGRHEVRFYGSVKERRLSLNGRPVRRVADYIGHFRAVVFCSEDVQLVKGPGRVRRRYLDLILSHTDPGYLALLLRYVEAVRSRNALLKRGEPETAVLEGFTREVIRTGTELMTARRELVPMVSTLAAEAYRQVADLADGDPEILRLEYAPSVRGDFAVELAAARSREQTHRMTWLGPHRDEVRLLLDERPAGQFGSEGQKRTIAIALKMAQTRHLAGRFGSVPVLLIDDIMGELDRRRRGGLMPLLEASRQAGGQVFLTCTEENWPRDLEGPVHRWEVRAGEVWAGTEKAAGRQGGSGGLSPRSKSDGAKASGGV